MPVTLVAHVKSSCEKGMTTGMSHLHLHLGHLADAFIQSDLQSVHLSKGSQHYIAVLHKDKNSTVFKHS